MNDINNKLDKEALEIINMINNAKDTYTANKINELINNILEEFVKEYEIIEIELFKAQIEDCKTIKCLKSFNTDNEELLKLIALKISIIEQIEF